MASEINELKTAGNINFSAFILIMVAFALLPSDILSSWVICAILGIGMLCGSIGIIIRSLARLHTRLEKLE